MIPRDYRLTGNAMGENLKTFIENHPDAFDILLFRSNTSAPATVAVNADVVGSMESLERAISYHDPIEGRAVKLPEGIPYEIADSGDIADGNMEQPTALLINIDGIPKQSIVQYEEYTSTTERRLVNLYIVSSEMISQAPGSGEKHFCIPFPAFSDVAGNTP